MKRKKYNKTTLRTFQKKSGEKTVRHLLSRRTQKSTKRRYQKVSKKVSLITLSFTEPWGLSAPPKGEEPWGLSAPPKGGEPWGLSAPPKRGEPWVRCVSFFGFYLERLKRTA